MPALSLKTKYFLFTVTEMYSTSFTVSSTYTLGEKQRDYVANLLLRIIKNACRRAFRKHTLTMSALALIIFVLGGYKGLGRYIGLFYYKIDDYVVTH